MAAVSGSNPPVGVTKYSYDALYQLTRADYPAYSASWTYDAIGNRTSQTIAGLTRPYTYYKNGTNPNNGQRLRTADTTGDFTYDANGNFTGTTTLGVYATWDFANRMASYQSTTYAYDYLGRRTSATTPAGTTRYISVGLNTAGERGPNVANDYLLGPGIDEPLAKHSADGSVSYYGADALSSVTLVTDSNGNVLEGASYSAWGERSFGSQLFGYTGREVGGPAWFYRARYYDVAHGRFLSEDPIGQRVDMNLYRYVRNRPNNFVDPLGVQLYVPGPPPRSDNPPGCTAGAWNFARDVEFDLGTRTAWRLRSGTPQRAPGTPRRNSSSLRTGFCDCIYEAIGAVDVVERRELWKRPVSCCGDAYTEEAYFNNHTYEREIGLLDRDPSYTERLTGLYLAPWDSCLCPPATQLR